MIFFISVGGNLVVVCDRNFVDLAVGVLGLGVR